MRVELFLPLVVCAILRPVTLKTGHIGLTCVLSCITTEEIAPDKV